MTGIVVLHYKDAFITRRCISSILKYEDDIKVYLVNNGTNDNFDDLKSEKIEVISLDTNKGYSKGNNHGLRDAIADNCEQVMLLNNDTLFGEPILAKLSNELEKNKVGAVSPIIYSPNNMIWFAGGLFNKYNARAQNLINITDSKPYITDYLSGCCVLIKSKLLINIGLLDEKFFFTYEDVDLSLRIREKGLSLLVIPATSLIHLVSQSAGVEDAPFRLYHLFYSRLLIINKHCHGLSKITSLTYQYILAILLIGKACVNLRSKAVTSILRGFYDYYRD